MKKFFMLFVAAVTAVTVVGASPAAAAQPSGSKTEAAGGFKMTVHSHSGPRLLFPADTLSYNFTEGESFAYSSRPCAGRAPFNDLGLNFTPDYPGVDDDADGTAAVRHHVQGTVTEVNGNGQTGTIEGTITSVLCQNKAETGNVIVTNFTTRYRVVGDNLIRLTGQFELSPTKSTGTFAGITGHGSIKAVLTCLAFDRGTSEDTCADIGQYTDFVAARGDLSKPAGELGPGLVGSFRDATVQTG